MATRAKRGRDTTRVLCIDVGVKNMGIVELERSGSCPPRLLSARKVDITNNGGCQRKKCRLGHTGAMVDWVAHLLLFDEELKRSGKLANLVLIERQPPMGFRDCEQLLFAEFRDKAKLVYPRSVHAHFKIGALTYEERKLAVCRIATHRFGGSFAWDMVAGKEERLHDVADAIIIGIWMFETDSEMLKRHRRAPTGQEITTMAGMEKHRYTKSTRIAV